VLAVNEFCTISDLRFLPHLLVLYRSLVEVCDDFKLRVFCLDDATRDLLQSMRLQGCLPVEFSRVEAHDPELLAIKHERMRSEYCWTATPAICRYVLDTEPSLGMITYVDADLMFFGDPGHVLRELDGDSVLLFPQRITSRDAEWSSPTAGSGAAERLTETYGSYNAGSITFRNDDYGRSALEWWRERCLEWCFDRIEPGRWADQRYLSELPRLFPGVRAATHPGAGLAPWNAHAHELERRDGRLLVNGLPAVFHHYQSLHLERSDISPRRFSWLQNIHQLPSVNDSVVARHAAWYSLTRPERELLWEPYLEQLDRAVADVATLAAGYVSVLPRLRIRDVIADTAHTAWLAAYRYAGRVLPGPARIVLSRARSSAWAQRVARGFHGDRA
jgi:hypothetical protein